MLISNITAIFKKELQSYFASPLAYLVASIFWILAGSFFIIMLIGPDGIITQVAAIEQSGLSAPPIDVSYEFIRSFLGVLGSLVLFILPILSMGLYAEERKRGTLELLATSPITNWSVAVGKLLGVVTFFSLILLPLVIYEAVVISTAKPAVDLTIPFVGHMGLILLAAAILSLGMFISSLTDSTILAAILSFAVVIALWIVDVAAASLPGGIGKALEHLSLLKNYSNLIDGVFDTSTLVLFISYILLGIFLTAQSIDTLRYNSR